MLKLGFTFPQYFNSCHVNSEVYVCGGYQDGTYFADCRKIGSEGSHEELHKMLNPKFNFPIVFWNKGRTLFTIGGNNGNLMREVSEYSVDKDTWKIHSQLPQPIKGSSAVVFNDVIYNIGGHSSGQSILWCDLNAEALWNPFEIPNYNFKNQHYRMAHPVEDKIVYFGS